MGFLIIQINNFWYILLQDLPAIFFYLLIAIVMHQIIQEYLLDRVNRKLHMSKVKHTKFNESGKINTISNQNRFPFPVQKNALVALMKHPTISRFFKVRTLWEGHKIGKNLPLILTKPLFLLSSVKTSGRFFQFFVAF